MKRLFSTLVLGGALALLVVTPVRGADREHQQMMADIRMLQEQTTRINLLLGSLHETLTVVLTRLDAQAQDTRRAFADQKLLVDNVLGGVRIVREKVDETNVRVSSLAQEVEALEGVATTTLVGSAVATARPAASSFALAESRSAEDVSYSRPEA